MIYFSISAPSEIIQLPGYQIGSSSLTLLITKNPNENDNSFVSPYSYNYPSNVDKSTFMVGSKNFRVSEMEVFNVK